MKLATLNDGSRDGQLVVVSRDLALAHTAQGIAGTLQAALDDWNFIAPQLEDLFATLNQGKARHAFPFEPRHALAPLPRAFHWAEVAWPASGEPVLHRHAGDGLAGPAGSGVAPDLAPALAVVTADVPAGAAPAVGLEGVRLLMLLASRAAADGAARFAAVAVTPDELGAAWHRGRAALGLALRRNGRAAGTLDLAQAQPRHFGRLIAALAASRRLGSGCIVGTGPLPAPEGSDAAAAFAGLQAGERLEMDALGPDGQSVFGPLELTVAIAAPAAAPPAPAEDTAP
jgi:fumarylacetoacetate (FAA) hydrolase